MKITILTLGSRGDIQPYIALGLELKKLCYKVCIVTLKNFEELVSKYGLEFYSVKIKFNELMNSDIEKDVMTRDNTIKVLKGLLSLNKSYESFNNLQKYFFEACKNSDIIIYHPLVPLGYFIAKHLGIPGILANPFPITPTKEYPSLLFYNIKKYTRVLNYGSHKTTEHFFWLFSKKYVKKFWQDEFGCIPNNFKCPYSRQNEKKFLTLTSCSNYVFQKPNDWPKYVYNTGYWFLEEESSWTPSVKLIDFLNEGPPPIYIGFGSIGGNSVNAVKTTKIVIDALKSSGQRGILATGWGGMSNLSNCYKNIFFIQSIPHSWLFPKMAAVIHHGGAGTTAAGLKAGVPGIIIPFTNDQFAWGQRIYELGVGAKAIPRKNLTSENLAKAIFYVLKKEIKETAISLGLKIQNENGAQAAAQIVHHSFKEV